MGKKFEVNSCSFIITKLSSKKKIKLANDSKYVNYLLPHLKSIMNVTLS